MSTVAPLGRPHPPLDPGQSLGQAEFHARYQGMPPGIRAELLDGVVVMPSPVGPVHCEDHFAVIGWLSRYRGLTPGVRGHDNASVALDDRNEVQPDALLRIASEVGGRTQADTVIRGVPELIVEVAQSSLTYDLGAKLREYERAGVVDYVVRSIGPGEVRWYTLRDGKLALQAPGDDGLYRSAAFPGLWLDPAALLANDLPRLWAVVDRGVATPEHAEFVARLARAGEGVEGSRVSG